MSADISGFWDGTYSYPDNVADPVPFEVEITQDGDSLSGVITEPNTFDTDAGVLLVATLSGEIVERRVEFMKHYRGGAEQHRVHYIGELHPKGLRITGQWSIVGFAGTFVMTRETGSTVQRISRAELAQI